MDEQKEGKKLGLDVSMIQVNVALILKGSLKDLDDLIRKLEKTGGILVVYKKASTKQFSVREE